MESLLDTRTDAVDEEELLNKVDEEELLDELYEVLTNLCHYYEGMKRELAKGEYDRKKAESDWTVLMHNERMNVIPILADMFQKVSES